MNNVDFSCHQVTWEDTDSSEDEDYLPQHPFQEVLPSIKQYMDSNSDRKRARMNSMDIETRDLFKRRVYDDEPRDKVRKVLDATIDNGIEEIDLSKMDLVDIPDEIAELQYVTVVQNDVVKTASLQLYLYSNQIQELCSSLFKLRNLTVLSLRNNRLTNIPVEIALLENLVELALGNNQLQTIPGEMLRIPKLEILSLLPNPFLTPAKNNRQILKSVSVTSLVEITTRLVLSNHTLNDEENIPMDIMHRLSFISPVNTCEQCNKVFLSPDVVEVHWKTPLTTRQPVPVLYRFCSLLCSDLYSS